MKLTIETLPVVFNDWDAFAGEFPQATTFHHSRWLHTLCRAYGAHIVILRLYEGSTCIAALPVARVRSCLTGPRWIALPYSDHCSILTNSQDGPTRLVMEAMRQRLRLELRLALNGGFCEDSQMLGTIHRTDLTTIGDDVPGDFHKTGVVQRLKRALSEGKLSVSEGTGLSDLATFYDLHLATRRRLRGLCQPWQYFLILREEFMRSGHGSVLTAWYLGKPVAGVVLLQGHGSLTYKHAASLPAFWKLAPNHLLIWHAMQAGRRAGLKWFDWGRTGYRSQSLRDFKRAWAPEESELTGVCLPGSGPRIPRLLGWLRSAVLVSQSICPQTFTRYVASRLYRHFP